MYNMVLDICRKAVRLRRLRGVLAVLQVAHQPLPPDELFGVEERAVRRLPPPDREIRKRQIG